MGKLEQDLDIIRIARKLRYLKYFVSQGTDYDLRRRAKARAQLRDNNVIDLDTTSDD